MRSSKLPLLVSLYLLNAGIGTVVAVARKLPYLFDGPGDPATATSLIGFPADDFRSSCRSPSAAVGRVETAPPKKTKRMAVNDWLSKCMIVERAQDAVTLTCFENGDSGCFSSNFVRDKRRLDDHERHDTVLQSTLS